MLTKALLIGLTSQSSIFQRADIRAQAVQLSAETGDGTTDTTDIANFVDTANTTNFADTTGNDTDIASGNSRSETKDRDIKAKIRERLKFGIVRNRRDTTFERTIPYIFYLPLALAWNISMNYLQAVGLFKCREMIKRSEQPTDEEVRKNDDNTIHEISMETLSELNKQREGESKLHYGEFMLTYYFLNLRTAFDTYDIFAQKQKLQAYEFKLKSDPANYEDGIVNHDRVYHGDFSRMR